MKRGIPLAATARVRRTTSRARHLAVICALGAIGMGAIECRAGPSSPQALSAAPRAIEQQASKPPGKVPDEVELDSEVVGRRVEPRPGDICMVCNQPVHDKDVVFVMRGQRIPIHLSELAPDLHRQLDELLAQLEPRGAFIGAGQRQPSLSVMWFWLGLYILIGLVFAAVCAHRALHAGYSPAAWFVFGLVLNLFGYLWLVTRPKREVVAPAGVPRGLRKVSATYAPRTCPGCSAPNHPSAGSCIACGGKLEPQMLSEVARVGLRRA